MSVATMDNLSVHEKAESWAALKAVLLVVEMAVEKVAPMVVEKAASMVAQKAFSRVGRWVER